MKKLIFLFMLVLCPLYSWAACTGTNYGDVSMTNLPEKILVNAGSYTAGTVLYDSGKITRAQTELINCEGSTYAVFAWSSNNAGALIGDNIYATSVQGSASASRCGPISAVNMTVIPMISAPTRRCIISAM